MLISGPGEQKSLWGGHLLKAVTLSEGIQRPAGRIKIQLVPTSSLPPCYLLATSKPASQGPEPRGQGGAWSCRGRQKTPHRDVPLMCMWEAFRAGTGMARGNSPLLGRGNSQFVSIQLNSPHKTMSPLSSPSGWTQV